MNSTRPYCVNITYCAIISLVKLFLGVIDVYSSRKALENEAGKAKSRD